MSFKESHIEREGVNLRLSLLEVENAVLAMFYTGGLRIGTLACAMPTFGEGKTTTSSVLLGAKYMIACRALAERVAAAFKKMSLVSINTSIPEGDAFKLSIELLEKFFASELGKTKAQE